MPDTTPHKPTDETKGNVRAMASCGVTQEDISKVIGIDSKTLRKYYREELDTSMIKANTVIAQSLYNQAKNGNTAAMIFWLKTRAKWSETIINENHDMTPKVIKDDIPKG